jgi:YHS domain-containing protein
MVRLLVYLFEVVIVFLFVRLLGRALQQFFGTPRVHFWMRTGPPPQSPPETRPGQTARDPVCGMFVSTELSHQLTHGTQTLHFCSRECLQRYQKETAHATS